VDKYPHIFIDGDKIIQSETGWPSDPNWFKSDAADEVHAKNEAVLARYMNTELGDRVLLFNGKISSRLVSGIWIPPEAEHRANINKRIKDPESTQPTDWLVVENNRDILEKQSQDDNIPMADSLMGLAEYLKIRDLIALGNHFDMESVTAVRNPETEENRIVFKTRLPDLYCVVKQFDQVQEELWSVKFWHGDMEKVMSYWNTDEPFVPDKTTIYGVFKALLRVSRTTATWPISQHD